jgi:heme exporter protein A
VPDPLWPIAVTAPALNLAAPDLIGEELACRRSERLIFTGLSFRLPAGGALLLTGSNGSGKTSLLRLVAGLLPPAAGRLAWGVRPVAADLAAHRASLHYVGHQDGIKAALTLRETLAFWAALRGRALSRSAPAIERALDALGLEGLAEWPCRWLSAGQRRRLALARLLVAPAPLWLLDEPMGALDADGRERLERAVADHCAAGGRVLLSTHLPLALDGASILALDRFAPDCAGPAPG